MEALLSIIIKLIKDRFCDPNSIKIDPDDSLSTIGLDSLDAVELAMELEKRFNIQIPSDVDSDFLLCSPNQIASYLSQRLNGYNPQLGPQVEGKYCFNTTEQMLKSLSQDIFHDKKDISQTYYVAQENRHYRVNYSTNKGIRIVPLTW